MKWLNSPQCLIFILLDGLLAACRSFTRLCLGCDESFFFVNCGKFKNNYGTLKNSLHSQTQNYHFPLGIFFQSRTGYIFSVTYYQLSWIPNITYYICPLVILSETVTCLIFHDFEKTDYNQSTYLLGQAWPHCFVAVSYKWQPRIAHVSFLQILVWEMQREVQCRGCSVSVPDQCYGIRQNTDGTDHSVWWLPGQILWHIRHQLYEVWLQNC